MKIATWNVNGIRAREAQVQDFSPPSPDVLCLQEIKASAEQVPAALCEMEGYWCYWHGVGGYSGVALHVQQDVLSGAPALLAPGLRPREPDRTRRACPGSRLRRSTSRTAARTIPAKMRFLAAVEAVCAATWQTAGRRW